MNTKLINQIKKYVESEFKKPTAKYGYEPFQFHLIAMVENAGKLADQLKADKEVVLLAAWLHDVGSAIGGRADHHILGAKIAVKKLQEFDYPPEKTELVRRCVLNHRGSVDSSRESTEEKIIADADALDNFNNIAGLFKAAFTYEKLDQGEGKKSVREKLQRKWKKLHFKASRDLARDKYKAAMILLK